MKIQNVNEPLIANEKIQIINTEVEGSCQIKYLEAIKMDRFRIFLGIVFSLLTGFIFTLVCSWSTKITRSFFFKKCEVSEATYFGVSNQDNSYGICKKSVEEGYITIVNRKLKYRYFEDISAFQALEFDLNKITKQEIHESYGKGLIGILWNLIFYQDYLQPQFIYGSCKIEIPLPSVLTYLLKELTSPFYILQYFSCLLWTLEGNPHLAAIMITFSITITTINYFLLMNSVKKLRKMAENKQNVKVFRPYAQNTHPLIIRSEELVPGDLLVIEPKLIIPCDCVLISGEVMLNEASLTGESVPVPKFPLDKTNQNFSFHEDKRNSLFEGTKVLLCKPHEEYVLALVVRTGFASFKGQIFRSVLYPKPQRFRFYEQGIKFMAVLAIWILILYFIILPFMIEIGFSPLIIASRFGDAITWIVPPALPIFVSMCMTYSLVRLNSQEILGVDPQKTLIAGGVNTICFDKTGTLTTTSIDVYGYQVKQDQILQPLVNADLPQNNKNDFIFKIFGSCHCVQLIEGELMGDSLDVEMFNYSNYQFENTNQKGVKFRIRNQNGYIDVLRILEFESSFMRMSVIVRENEKTYLFSKGSPEKISELSEKSSIPSNLKQQLDTLTMRGLRVLGLGVKELKDEEVESFIKESTPRHVIEQQLQFFGLLIIENKLKCDTKAVINDLMLSGLDLKIISGDNGLTTVQCARECSIISEQIPILLLDYDNDEKALILQEIEPSMTGESKQILEQNTSNNKIIQNNHKQVMQQLIKHLIVSENTMKNETLRKSLSIQKDKIHDIDKFIGTHGFAITGKAFDYFWAQQPIDNYSGQKISFAEMADPLQDVPQLELEDVQITVRVFQAIVKKARVFARMRPEQKSQVVQQLQALGRTVAMIGDGANDCAAIKQANVGISFAQSDASYSAPFSSRGESLSCVKKVLLDGRAALANTIEVFQFYVYASVIKYVAAELMATQGENFSSIQVLFVNYVQILPYLKAITLVGPINQLKNTIPQDDMFKLPNIVTIYFHLVVNGVGLLLNFLYWRQQSWIEPPETNPNKSYKLEGTCQTTLFICIQIYISTTLFCIYISKPFKKPIYKQKLLFSMLVSLMILNIYTFFGFNGYQKFLNMYNLKEKSQSNIYLEYQFLICCAVILFQILGHFLYIVRVYPCYKHIMSPKKIKQQQDQTKQFSD